MNHRVACIIPAAGWGSVCPVRSTPKVTADIHGELMINRIVSTVKQAGVVDTIIVVIGDDEIRGNDYGRQTREALLAAGHTDVKFAIQPHRRGAADAVSCALPLLDGEDYIYNHFGDMPLPRETTIRSLVEAALSHPEAVITMATVCPPPGHPTENFGRVILDESGEIMEAREPNEMNGVELKGAKLVSPSFYLFQRWWLEENLPHIPPKRKDHFGDEYHLPELLPMAHRQGRKIFPVRLEDPWEAVGVNNASQLALVQELLRQRNGYDHHHKQLAGRAGR